MKLISLTQGKHTIVDDDIFEILNKKKWYAWNSYPGIFYACLKGRDRDGKRIMEKVEWYAIGKPLNGLIVDHVNGNSLDNRRENLRVVTQRENNQNRKMHRDGRLVGATWKKSERAWVAQIFCGDRQYRLGSFKTELDAHNTYLNALDEIKNGKLDGFKEGLK